MECAVRAMMPKIVAIMPMKMVSTMRLEISLMASLTTPPTTVIRRASTR
jgi:hypothetical protein